MQFIRIHRRACAIVALALAATAISGSAASARPLEGPLHQTAPTGPAVSPILPPAQPSGLRAAEAQQVRALSSSVPPAARSSNAELNAHSKAAPTAAVPAAKIGAPSDGFYWGDAAIGGGIAVLIVLLVAGGTLIVRRRIQLGEA